MNITELQAKLEQIKASHGDMDCHFVNKLEGTVESIKRVRMAKFSKFLQKEFKKDIIVLE